MEMCVCIHECIHAHLFFYVWVCMCACMWVSVVSPYFVCVIYVCNCMCFGVNVCLCHVCMFNL